MENSILYPQLIKSSHALAETIRDFVANKPEHLLVQRPSADKWSFLECIAHLNLTYADYLPRLQSAIEQNTERKGSRFKQGFFGRMMINSMRPKNGKIKMKVKTLGKFQPTQVKLVRDEVIDTFLTQHRSFIEMLEAAQPLHGGQIRLDSAIGSLLRFRLGDCCAFLVGHNERHWLQAQNAYATVTAGDKITTVNFIR